MPRPAGLCSTTNVSLLRIEPIDLRASSASQSLDSCPDNRRNTPLSAGVPVSNEVFHRRGFSAPCSALALQKIQRLNTASSRKAIAPQRLRYAAQRRRTLSVPAVFSARRQAFAPHAHRLS